MADEYTFAKSLAPQDTEFEFDTRQFVFIPDQNNSAYPNGQVQFDLAGLSNSGKFVDWSQSVIQVPLVLNVHSSAGAFAVPTVASNFGASLKNHVYQLIHSMDVQLSNNSITNLTSFSNLDINYKLLNTLSSEEVDNLAPTLLFGKDTAESIQYTSAANAAGIGERNNDVDEVNFSSANGWSYTQNKGRADRMKYTSFDPAGTQPDLFTTAQISGNVGKNYMTKSTSDLTYYILATLRLKDLHDVFDKLPLMRGAYLRITLNLNTQCKSTHTLGGVGTTYDSISVQSPNGTLPFMLSPIGEGLEGGGTSTELTASLGIAKSFVPAGTYAHPTINQCRLYACCYTMSPIYEEKYFSMVPTKRVLYNDILTFQQLNVALQANVN